MPEISKVTKKEYKAGTVPGTCTIPGPVQNYTMKNSSGKY